MRHPPGKRLIFPTVPLSYAKDQCEALSEGEIGVDQKVLWKPLCCLIHPLECLFDIEGRVALYRNLGLGCNTLYD